MIYYSKNLEELDFSPNEQPFNHGTQGKIYKINDDKCIKLYYEDSPKIDQEIFTILKDLELPGVYKLYELLYSERNLKELAGYTMKYYRKEINNILNIK